MADPDFNYHGFWKSITLDWSTIFTAYWADLSPTKPSSSWWAWNWLRATWETTYDCSWFQVGNTVCAFTFTYVSWGYAGETNIQLYLQEYRNWWQSTWWDVQWTWTLSANWFVRWFWELSIIQNQFRDNASRYRMLVYWQSWSYSSFYTDEIQLDYLYPDTTEYEPWLITVDWSYLIYTDYWWYKHKVQYDTWFSWSYAGTDKAWHFWIQDWVVRRLYYVDEYWYVQRTYQADNWKGYTSWQWASVWTSYKWSLWTGSWASDWSNRYLCFVNSSWYKMRLMNGDPNNF